VGVARRRRYRELKIETIEARLPFNPSTSSEIGSGQGVVADAANH